MKKFVIISTVLLLIAGGIFGYSLKHYIDVMHPFESSSSSKKSSDDTSDDAEETAPTEPNLTPAVDLLSDGGIFSENYGKAKTAVSSMSVEELAGQVILGVCSDLESGAADITQYRLAGYLFESDAFHYLSEDEITEALASMSSSADIAPILAAQEEGGEVTTVSDNGMFPENSYDSPRTILESGNLQDVERTELEKATFLKGLGFNVNFAPVVDMPDSYDQIMYSRALSEDKDIVSDFAKYCAKHIQAKGVSVVLKHFPGYGTVTDAAAAEAALSGAAVIDDRSASDIRENDYEPFKAGAQEGVHFIMVSNVVIENIDPDHTAALSSEIHKELRETVGFTGLIVTDVIDDADYSQYADGNDAAVAALLAGNDLILSRNYSASYSAILAAVDNGVISEDLLRQACTRVLAYKYSAGLI